MSNEEKALSDNEVFPHIDSADETPGIKSCSRPARDDGVNSPSTRDERGGTTPDIFQQADGSVETSLLPRRDGQENTNSSRRKTNQMQTSRSEDQYLKLRSAVIVFRFDETYFWSLAGILRLIQVAVTLAGLICLVTSGSSGVGSYLHLPLDWHLRAYVFICVCGLLVSLLLLFVNVMRLAEFMPINWDLLDVVVYGVLTFLYLFCASLVASAVDFYQKLDANVSEFTLHRLIIATVLGYCCLFLYGATALLSYRRWNGLAQFDPRRLSSTSLQRNHSRPIPRIHISHPEVA